MAWDPTDERPHGGAVDEWVFAAWSDDGRIGALSGHRLVGRTAWYWSALVEHGQPLLHLCEWAVKVRADPFIVKAPEMWAEHVCDAPMEQWSVGNEAYAASLDDPDEALGRGFGVPTPMAFDLEWYAVAAPTAIEYGYQQVGVVHGMIEIQGRSDVTFAESPAHRWRRWRGGDDVELPPVELDEVVAHTGLRAPFAFPDGSVADWVVTPRGWRARRS